MVRFSKFHGTGNDFIMLDGRNLHNLPAPDLIRSLCHRRTGIGADGLIVLNPIGGYDFEMIYFNADGSRATMCGNGARCAVAFGFISGMCGTSVSFLAGDGPHTGKLEVKSEAEWMVEISIGDIQIPEKTGVRTEIHTGTPHLVVLTDDPEKTDVVTEGRKIRYSAPYSTHGINVNFMSVAEEFLRVRTYEKGVEDETLSCGTGVTACAAVASLQTGKTNWTIQTPGGMLEVRLDKEGAVFRNVRLKGPASRVYNGELADGLPGHIITF